MRFCIIIFILLSSCLAFSQMDEAWVARYNGTGNSSDSPSDITVDGEGFIYVTGTSYGSDGYEDYATVKYDPDGDTVWTARYSGPGSNSDQAHCLAVDDNGNVYVTGQSKGSGSNFDCTTVKYDSDGVQQWVARHNGPDNGIDSGQKLVVDDYGNVYVAGYIHISGDTDYDYITIKYNSDGDTLWTAVYHGPGPTGGDFPFGIALDNEYNVFVTGKSEGVGAASNDYLTIKYSNDGIIQWATRYNGPGNGGDVANDIKVDADGNCYVAGYCWGGSGHSYDIVTTKYDPDGVQQWVSQYNGPVSEGDCGYSMFLDDDNYAYTCGYSYGTGNNGDLVAIKCDPDGNRLWVSSFNGVGNDGDYGQDIVVDDAGNVFVGGYTSVAAYTYDFILIEFNADGDSVWANQYNGPGDGNEMNVSLAIDNQNNIYFTGKSIGDGTGYDYTTFKYAQHVGIEDKTQSSPLPDDYDLVCYPNPFNATARISFSLDKPEQVKLAIYNLNGQLVENLVDQYQPAGNYGVIWDGSNIAAGVYFYRLDISGESVVKRVTLLK